MLVAVPVPFPAVLSGRSLPGWEGPGWEGWSGVVIGASCEGKEGRGSWPASSPLPGGARMWIRPSAAHGRVVRSGVARAALRYPARI
ncbi:hypothetical protein GCM10017784_17030 [Deinococcus indicus]|nr:hypothetical protein GCM10017784_17030 [Deinococcus indicus]